MAKNRKDSKDAKRRRLRVAQMYLQKRKRAHIALQTGVHPATISADIKKIEEEWRKDTAMALDVLKAKEIATIDEVERQAWRAWFRSIGDHTIETTKSKDDEQKEVTKQTRKLVGSVQYLNVIMDCVEKRAKLLGMYLVDTEDGNKDLDQTQYTVSDFLKTLESMTDQYKEQLVQMKKGKGRREIEKELLKQNPEMN